MEFTAVVEPHEKMRGLEVPDAVAAALDAAGVRAAFDARTASQRRQHVRVIDQAKQPETRTRRIGALIEELGS